MEKSLIKLIDDINEIEDTIALKIKESTFSEIILPSTSIEAEEIKEDPETQGMKFIEVGEGKDKMIVPLCTITTPRYCIGLDDIDPKKDMKRQIIDIASKAIGGAWDSQLIKLADAAVMVSDNITERPGKVLSRREVVDLFNLIDQHDIESKIMLVYKDIWELMKSWMEVDGINTEEREGHKPTTSKPNIKPPAQRPARSIKHVIEALNQALKNDTIAINKLFAHREVCNIELADHRSVQVSQHLTGRDVPKSTHLLDSTDHFSVGVMGFINMVLVELGYPMICSLHDDEDKIIGFDRFKP